MNISLLLFYANEGLTVTSGQDASDPLKFWVQVASLSGAALALLTFLLVQTWPRIRTRLDSRSIQKRIGAESYTPDSITRSLRYFIAPMCQDLDPSGGEEPRMVYGVRQRLFDALDDALSKPHTYKHLILLADSGMGKTTALLNYYVRHLRRWRKRDYQLALVPLSNSKADHQIKAIANPADTVLFLDALDEDTLAVTDYKDRLKVLLDLTYPFRAVVISCRTQFFSKDEEIPKETGVLKVFARPAGEEAMYYFHKLYLSPFSNDQVDKYINRLYPFWRFTQRQRAKLMVRKIQHLTARPMLLAHIDDLVKAPHDFRYPYELYEEMIKAWLKREQGFIKDIIDLQEFSERLAVDIYFNRIERKSERIKKTEVTTLANDWNIAVEDWKLTGRSLLNRDAEGNYKFAHRSIMEYLFVKRFLKGDSLCTRVDWTDQMNSFLWDILEKQMGYAGSLPFLSGDQSRTASVLLSDQTISILSRVVAQFIRYIEFPQTDRKAIATEKLLTVAALCAFIAQPDGLYPVYVSLFSGHIESVSYQHSCVLNYLQRGSGTDANSIRWYSFRSGSDRVPNKDEAMFLEIIGPPPRAIEFQTVAGGKLSTHNLGLLSNAIPNSQLLTWEKIQQRMAAR
jgi:hypothetical protein